MKLLKRNQIIIFVIALMLVSAGYLNYTSMHQQNSAIPTSSQANKILELAGIGDAQLVNSNNVVQENEINQNTIQNIVQNNEIQETSSESKENIQNEVTNNITNNVENNITNNEYFTSSKLSRDTMYSQMIESYQKILENETISADQKSIAQNEIKNINTTKNSIMIAENLIQNKGFKNVVIFVNDVSVSVIIEAKELTQEQIAQIQNIVTRELKVEIENVHISTK